MKKIKTKQIKEEYRVYHKEIAKALGIKLKKDETIEINEVFVIDGSNYLSIEIVKDNDLVFIEDETD